MNPDLVGVDGIWDVLEEVKVMTYARNCVQESRREWEADDDFLFNPAKEIAWIANQHPENEDDIRFLSFSFIFAHFN